MRRPLLAFALSVAIHSATAVAVVVFGIFSGTFLPRPIEFELVSDRPRAITELPLGPPPPRGQAAQNRAARPRKIPKETAAVATVAADPAPDAGAPDTQAESSAKADAGDARAGAPDAQREKPGDLRTYGPEGSRLTALLRLDRLRDGAEAASYIAVVDDLLQMLPDRRRLIEGTGMNLYKDFDALLIATPNPTDDAVTFVAARHHLTDAALQAALSAGGASVGRPIVWSTERDRPVAVRPTRKVAPNEPIAVPLRDDRIIVLPQPGLAIIAPPAYAKLLLAGKGDAAAAAADWQQLAARIDAEHGAMPDGAVLLVTAANLLKHNAPSGAMVVPGTTNTSGGPPDVATLVMGTTPAPFIELCAEFSDDKAAAAWEAAWPTWQRKAMSNPLAMLGGIAPLLARAELRREDRTLIVRTTASHAQALGILRMAATFARGRGGF